MKFYVSDYHYVNKICEGSYQLLNKGRLEHAESRITLEGCHDPYKM